MFIEHVFIQPVVILFGLFKLLVTVNKTMIPHLMIWCAASYLQLQKKFLNSSGVDGGSWVDIFKALMANFIVEMLRFGAF